MRINAITQILYEQGMEGIGLCLYDPSKTGWAGHIDLKNGDYLEIPNKFKGYIKRTKTTPGNPYKWCQEGWNKEDWYMLFYTEQPCVYRKNYTKTIYTPEFNLERCIQNEIIY